MPKTKKGASKNKKDIEEEQVEENEQEEQEEQPEEDGDDDAEKDDAENEDEEKDDEEVEKPSKSKKSAKAGKPSKGAKAADSDDESAAAPPSEQTGVPPCRYRLSEVNFENVEVGEMDMSGSQPMAHINYYNSKLQSDTKLLCQAKKIKLTGHGIPPLHDEYCPDDSKREYMKIPLDPAQEACNELRAHLEAADEFYGSEEMKVKLFGKKANDYEYQKCVRTPTKKDDDEDDDDDEDNKKKKSKKGGKGNKGSDKKKYPVYDYCKMKFNMSKAKSAEGKKSKEPSYNLTKLKRLDANGKSTLTPAKTITQIAELIPFLSEITIIFYHTRVWAMKTKLPGASKKMYGVALKIMFILYTPAASRGVKSDDLDLLPSDEEDDAEATPPPKKNGKNNKAAKPTKKAKLDDDDDAGDDGGDDAAEEQEDIPVSKKKKKAKAAANDDEDNEDADAEEEEIKPKKKSKSASKNKD